VVEKNPSPTISLRERSFPMLGLEERLPKWVVVSLLLHLALIACLFLIPMLPSRTEPLPVYTVDLVGGEKIGAANLATELAAPPKPAGKSPQAEKNVPAPEPKREVKKEKPEKEEKAKAKPVEKKPAVEEKIVLKEKTTEKIKPEPTKAKPANDTKSETKSATKEMAKSETSADSVRERLIQSAVDRAKARTESAEKPSKGEQLSAGSGEGAGAAALGVGGRGGPGIVKGMDFIIYQNRIFDTIKGNWAWVGQRSSLKVVVHFSIKETGEISGLKIVQPSGDPSYDESVLRAVKKSSPLPAPPESYRKDFADVEVTFRPKDLGA
jgi:colicin import membrane protein